MFIFEKQHYPIDMSDVSTANLYQTDTILPYVIKTQTDNQTIGYLFAERRDDLTLYIQFIEIIDELKEQGFGTQVVRSIFSAFQVKYLEGTTLLDDCGRAYYFWSSLGAEMSVDGEDFECNNYDDIAFVLNIPAKDYLPGVVIQYEPV